MSRRLRVNESVDEHGYIRRDTRSNDNIHSAGFFFSMLLTAIAALVWFFNWVRNHWIVCLSVVVSLIVLSLLYIYIKTKVRR
jgi:hypothetical protein